MNEGAAGSSLKLRRAFRIDGQYIAGRRMKSIGRQPSVLVLDEPTADLDARGTRSLKATLEILPHTIFLITHDYDLARGLCRKAVVLADGTAAEFEDIRSLFDDRARMDHWALL